MLGARLGAVHDGVAAIKPKRVFEIVEPFAGGLVARIGNPTIGLQQRRRTEKALRIPPVARARGRAAGAKNAFVEPIKLRPIVVTLLPFLLRRRRNGAQPRP